MRVTLFIAAVLTMLLAGCEEPTASTSPAPSTAKSSSGGPPPPPHLAEQEDGEHGDDADDDDDFVRSEAEVGVGKKGRNYGGGVISEPIRQMYRAEQKINLLNVEHALKLYRAEHGKFPASHDEFMKKIIKANDIELPELPDGERYAFDPKTGKLMVERPKQ